MFRKHSPSLLDLCMASCAICALVTSTPTGELARRAARWALGRGGPDVALTAFFGRMGALAPGSTFPPEQRAIAALAPRLGTLPALLRGFALASAVDPSSPEITMDLTAAGRSLLIARGASREELSTAQGRLRAVGAALGPLGSELGSPDAALCALVLGPTEVRWAAERARAERAPLSLEALARHLSPGSRHRAQRVVGEALTFATALDLSWPVPRTTPVTSLFGSRVDPLTGLQTWHPGIDLALAQATPIAAAGDGVIQRAGEDGLNGKFLVVDHGRGVTTTYCHASALLAARGERVLRGQRIARSGNTGRSTGPHLHYQIALSQTPVDPLALGAAAARLSPEVTPASVRANVSVDLKPAASQATDRAALGMRRRVGP